MADRDRREIERRATRGDPEAVEASAAETATAVTTAPTVPELTEG